MQQRPRNAAAVAALVAAATGLAIGISLAEPELREAVPTTADIVRVPDLEPLDEISHTATFLAMREAEALLAHGRPWSAWEVLKEHVDEPDHAAPAAALVAARAAAGWGGWGEVRALLRGRDWLDREGGEGWRLLARAEEAGGNAERAAGAWRRHAAAAPEARARGVARARLGELLAEMERPARAADAFGAAAAELPDVADWLLARQAEALRDAGDPRAASVAAMPGGGAAARTRQAVAAAEVWAARGDLERALRQLEAEEQSVAAIDAPSRAATLRLERAELLGEAGRAGEARALLWRVVADSAVVPRLRERAARALGALPVTNTPSEQLARASAYEAAGEPGLAARALRSALERGAPDDATHRLRLGMLLFEERDFGPARVELRRAAGGLSDPAARADAELHAARALFRSGSSGRAQALEEMRSVAERFPGTPAAGTALFLLADEAATNAAGVPLYRRAAGTASSPDAREALYRLGDRLRRLDRDAEGREAWETYLRRYPRGEQTAEVAYRLGVEHERAGREERARGLYRTAIAADPLSYHALRAAERAGLDPLSPTLAEPKPWFGLASDPTDAAAGLRRLALLEEAGLEGAWREELDEQLDRLAGRPAALLALAEGLRDAGHTIEAIRLGRRLGAARGDEWDPRLLRVVFPLPHRDLLLDEADRLDIDPWLLAGLIRQESMWNPEARSWVGASGLTQMMPATGRWLAPSAGIDDFQVEMLTVPEVSLRMGARYLRDQLRRYDGARDLALAAYNAGPGRADRWRRTLRPGRDTDAFRDAIPFDETRHYVKVVLRNAEVYRRLYGERRSPGLMLPYRAGGDG